METMKYPGKMQEFDVNRLLKVDILQTMHWVKKAWPLVKVETEQNCFYYGTPLMQLHPS